MSLFIFGRGILNVISALAVVPRDGHVTSHLLVFTVTVYLLYFLWSQRRRCYLMSNFASLQALLIKNFPERHTKTALIPPANLPNFPSIALRIEQHSVHCRRFFFFFQMAVFHLISLPSSSLESMLPSIILPSWCYWTSICDWSSDSLKGHVLRWLPVFCAYGNHQVRAIKRLHWFWVHEYK